MPHTRLVPLRMLSDDQLAKLRSAVPEAFADGRINWNALHDSLEGHLEEEGSEAEHFGLTWPGKRAARRLGVTPSLGALVPVSGEGLEEGTTKNLFLEGDNLEVLKLLQKAYAGSVKMIYIDPPYNTGNDFVYSDNYAEPLEEYLRRTGQADERGRLLTTNTRAEGRFHSNWLSMIYPRLRAARELLAPDGVVFVSIDDNEFHNLRHVMNEVFGEEGFIATFIWHRRQIPDSRNESKASTDHEYVLCYQNAPTHLRGHDRDPELFNNPDDDPRGPWTSTDLTGLATKDQRPNLHYVVTNPETGSQYPPSPERGWAVSKEKFAQFIEERRILWPTRGTGRPRLKRFFNEAKDVTTSVSSVLEDVGYTLDGTREIQELFGERIMSFPKPSKLIKFLVRQGTTNDSIVMDFFAGSGTTAQAVFELNREDGGTRRVILVQLPEPTPDDSVPARAGFATIAEIGKERIRRVASRMLASGPRENEDLGFRVLKLARSSFTRWRGYTGTDLAELQTLFSSLDSSLEEGWTQEGVMTEVLLLEGFPLDSTVSTHTAGPTSVRVVTSSRRGHRLIVNLDAMLPNDAIEALALQSEDVLVCLDTALNDEQKIRLADRCNLKTI